jgi:hypothetical protein
LNCSIHQGCQMVHFKTKNANFGIFWKALRWTTLGYFIVIWYNYLSFGIFIAILVYFEPFGIFLSIFRRFDLL